MIFALDFDKTYTEDPRFWQSFIDMAEENGHEVFIVTVRHSYWDAHPLLDELSNRSSVIIVYTDGRAKRVFCEGLGIKIDIWIDDRPETIISNSSWKHSSSELRAWREENYKKLAEDGYHGYVRDLSMYDMEDEWE